MLNVGSTLGALAVAPIAISLLLRLSVTARLRRDSAAYNG
jgi:hypothetical protein